MYIVFTNLSIPPASGERASHLKANGKHNIVLRRHIGHYFVVLMRHYDVAPSASTHQVMPILPG